MKLKLLFAGYTLTLICLFLYSFTQIDLSLALSRNESLQVIVRAFQEIGYFQRPFSTYLFITILLLLFSFYITFLVLAHRQKLSQKYVWSLVLTSVALLTFSYNAFSYDIFNYIFDARIFTHYHQNPYIYKALDFPGDPMLSFMRWVHRVYPYGPVWLGLTVPLSYAGFQYFLPTFLLFKLFMSANFVASVYFIGKIFQKIAPKRELFGIIFFSLSPLVLIESIVSAHIDIVMTAFALGALYYLVSTKYISSYVMLLLSIGIKFMTGLLAPLFILIHILQKKNKTIHWNFYLGIGLILLVIGVVLQSNQSGNFQPWYLITPLAIAVFISHRYYIVIPSMIISLAALLNYVPYLFMGNWDKPVPQIQHDLNFLSYSLSIFTIAAVFFIRQMAFAKKAKHKNK